MNNSILYVVLAISAGAMIPFQSAMNSQLGISLQSSGGFVLGENFGKDDYISLYSQGMTYELLLQQNGNLSTEPSSMNEAFK